MTATLSSDLLKGIQSHNDATELKRLFDQIYEGVNYPPIDVYRTLFLCASIDFNHTPLVTLLLSLPTCDINYTFGYVIPSPLHVAVLRGNSTLVRVLLDAGASVNLESRTQTAVVSLTDAISAVESACVSDNPEILEILLPMYDREQTRARRTPLHHACWHGAYKCVRYLLAADISQSDINALDSDDPHQPERYTALMLGISHGAPLVQLLLTAGASVSCVTERLRCNILHRAVSRTSHLRHGFVPVDLPEVVQLVIDTGGCDVNAFDASGDTSLSILCTQTQCLLSERTDLVYPYDVVEHRRAVTQTAEILLTAGANPDGDPRSRPLVVLSAQMLKTLPMQRLEAGNLDNAGFRRHLETTGFLFELTSALFQLFLFHGADPNVIGCRDTRTLTNQIIDVATQVMEKQEHLLQADSLNQTYGQCWLDSLTHMLTLLLVSGATVLVNNSLIALFWRAAACSFPSARVFIRVILSSLDERCLHELKMRLSLEDVLTMALIRTNNATTTPGRALQWVSDADRPRRLKCLVRGAIINSMKKRSLRGVSTLGLPSPLVRYILFLSD